MKIVVIGGTGLIGSKVVKKLSQLGHEAVAASPASGVNTVTGEGLAEVLQGAQVVVDLANSPNFEDKVAMDFFVNSGRNLLAAEAVAGVRHHIALSVVGTSLMQDSGYFRAKLVQENMIRNSGIPFSIIHSTQFFEFLAGIANSGTEGKSVHLPPAAFQPIAAEDVAAAVVDVAMGAPVNGFLEIAGPDSGTLSGMVEYYLSKMGDPRKVVPDAKAQYFGLYVDNKTLVPGNNPRLGAVNFEAWFKGQLVAH